MTRSSTRLNGVHIPKRSFTSTGGKLGTTP